MATNKTLAPTGVTVQVPAMSDPPSMAVPANAIDKTIDAVNALNSQLATVSKLNQYSKSTGSTAGNLIFETSENRYNALVFLVDNNAASNSAIYSVIYKQDVTNNVVRLAGSGNSVTVDFSTGKITVACGTWSTAVVLSTTTMS